MSIRSRCKRRLRRAAAVVTAGCLVGLVAGCGMSGGKLLFASGLFQPKKVEARFRLTKNPILILVDDPRERVDWPVFSRLLTDDLAQELLRNEAAAKIVPIQTLQSIQQTETRYAERGAREIGELAGAEQVLWIEVQDFLVQEEVEAIDEAAYAVVSVRVLNVLEKNKYKVRVFPDNPQGEIVSVQLTSSEVSRAKTKDAIAKELSARLSLKIGRYFYDYRPEDFEGEAP
ncbi:MAG: hypothetical protein KJ057_05890 [Phycisphaerae bacterium]|nr:MAG: hypothetical protein F9K17_07605 [Phycisphaerae bacterium]MBE7458076.1 hypothetical protein [Planctomycetia bacterium]MCK6464459.1 hypothetical protein [Phycisphaerae bacterium]MCL4717990.1 hypothetical protein [Phycisphaerae bacterium]NUQ07748.1 hypothetical protein [Phycisphaerae bacterium]